MKSLGVVPTHPIQSCMFNVFESRPGSPTVNELCFTGIYTHRQALLNQPERSALTLFIPYIIADFKYFRLRGIK